MQTEIPDIPANKAQYVWVFKSGPQGQVGGIFSSFRSGHKWIKAHTLSGLLMHYPLDMGVYDWAYENQFLSKVQLENPGWRAGFTTASQHYHVYESGNCLDWPEYDELEEPEATEETIQRELYYPPHDWKVRDEEK